MLEDQLEDHPPISLVLTHFNRFPLLCQCVSHVIDDARIGEIVIVDDNSTDGSKERLISVFGSNPKVQLVFNAENIDCYRNKKKAMEWAKNEWCILFDSDNIIKPSYLDVLYHIQNWRSDVVYCPDFAEPHFDYREHAGGIIDRTDIHQYVNRRNFLTALNTCNYFVHRETYLKVWDGSVNPHTVDSMFQMLNWLEAGNKLVIVPGLRYFHRVHAGSHYKLNVHKTGNFAQVVENRIKALR